MSSFSAYSTTLVEVVSAAVLGQHIGQRELTSDCHTAGRFIWAVVEGDMEATESQLKVLDQALSDYNPSLKGIINMEYEKALAFRSEWKTICEHEALASDPDYIAQQWEEAFENEQLAKMEEAQRKEWEAEQAERIQIINEAIAPYDSVEEWFDNLNDSEQQEWHDLYTRYMYSPEGDAVITDDNYLTWSVMDLLQRQDSYLSQPYCARCDSRGHTRDQCDSR